MGREVPRNFRRMFPLCNPRDAVADIRKRKSPAVRLEFRRARARMGLSRRAYRGDWPSSLRGAIAHANARVTERDGAVATVLAAAFEAIAARLKHLTAFGVAARESNRAAPIGPLAGAVIAAQAEVAELNAIQHAAARAAVVTKRLAKTLEFAAVVNAAAFDAEAALALLKSQIAFGFGQNSG